MTDKDRDNGYIGKSVLGQANEEKKNTLLTKNYSMSSLAQYACDLWTIYLKTELCLYTTLYFVLHILLNCYKFIA